MSGPIEAAAGYRPLVPMRTVLVLSSAIHTDLALPANPDVTAQFGFMSADGLDPT